MSKEILKLKKILFIKEKLYDSLQSAKVLRFQWINLKPWYILFIFKCQVLGYTENYILYLASLVAQTVKNLPAMQETHVWSLDQEDPLEKGMTTHFSILAWRIPWTEEPSGLQSLRPQRVPLTNTFTFHFLHLSLLGSMPQVCGLW